MKYRDYFDERGNLRETGMSLEEKVLTWFCVVAFAVCLLGGGFN